MLSSIYWKPEISWRVHEIWLLKKPKYQSIMRNEIKNIQSPRKNFLIVEEERTQRNSLILRDVEFVIVASIHGRNLDLGKHLGIFNRRLERGQCYRRPCLGQSEFFAEFGPVGKMDVPDKSINDIAPWTMANVIHSGEDVTIEPTLVQITSGILKEVRLA